MKQIDTALSRLGQRQRLAFAAACSERLLSAYDRFVSEVGWGDAAPLREALAVAWRAAAGDEVEEELLRGLANRCESVVPDLDDRFDSDFAAPAQNAAIAVVRTLECVNDRTRATNVADLALDASDQEETVERLANRELDQALIEELRGRASRAGFADR